MNFVTVGTGKKLTPDKSSELYAAVGAGLIAETGLILDDDCKLPSDVEKQMNNVIIKRGLNNLNRRFLKPISLYLSSQDPQMQTELLESMKPRQMTSLDTHKSWITSKKTQLNSLKDRVDIMFLNQEEAEMMSGKDDPMEAAKSLANGCICVVKMGPEGVIVADAQAHHLPAFPVEVVDDRFAGDAFAGGFTAYLSKRPSLIKAALYGNVVASFAVEGEGIQKLLKTKRNDVVKRYKEYLKLF